MKQKVATKDLAKGMYVSELDRPWLETPFLFQGFVLRTEEELQALRECCHYVYIDEEKGAASSAATTHYSSVVASEQKHAPLPHQKLVEEEMGAARKVRQVVETQMTELLHEARLGKGFDVKRTRGVVADIMESLIRNPDALMLLSHIRQHEKEAEAHAINSSILALIFGRYLQLSPPEVEELGLAALLHDIGETAIAVELLKNGAKNASEERQLQQHTKLGAYLLRKLEGMPEAVIAAALQHHEQIDGHGYPSQLKGDEISRAGQIMAIINTYDRITNASGGPQLPPSEALRYLYLYRDKLFSSELTEAFIQCLGIYPIGSIVELMNGSVGIVISIPPEDHLHPRILLLLGQHKQLLEPPHIMNLAIFTKKDAGKYAIQHVHPPGSFGIDISRYLRDNSLL
jgi:HD-GYP domain-containing protein (c-di-GMP phosphodiesterase class II)